VGAGCLSGLSSYRFAGAFALQGPRQPAVASPPSGGEGAPLAGSLANLLGHVTFRGQAEAPDRYEAQIDFGGSDVQPVEIRRIGAETFSRFGDGSWSSGNALTQFGPLAQLDPQSFCQTFLTSVEAPEQAPVRETVNGVPSLRYEVNGAQIGRGVPAGRSAGPARAPAATPDPSGARLIVWSAERGGYPVRIQVSAATGARFALSVDVTDANGRDVRISRPG